MIKTSSDLKTYQSLVPLRSLSSQESIVVTGDLICLTRHYGRLLNTTSSEVRRPLVLTGQGILILYMKGNTGFNIVLSKCTDTVMRMDFVHIKNKNDKMRRCTFKIRFPYGAVQLILLNDEICKWRNELIRAIDPVVKIEDTTIVRAPSFIIQPREKEEGMKLKEVVSEHTEDTMTDTKESSEEGSEYDNTSEYAERQTEVEEIPTIHIEEVTQIEGGERLPSTIYDRPPHRTSHMGMLVRPEPPRSIYNYVTPSQTNIPVISMPSKKEQRVSFSSLPSTQHIHSAYLKTSNIVRQDDVIPRSSLKKNLFIQPSPTTVCSTQSSHCSPPTPSTLPYYQGRVTYTQQPPPMEREERKTMMESPVKHLPIRPHRLIDDVSPCEKKSTVNTSPPSSIPLRKYQRVVSPQVRDNDSDDDSSSGLFSHIEEKNVRDYIRSCYKETLESQNGTPSHSKLASPPKNSIRESSVPVGWRRRQLENRIKHFEEGSVKSASVLKPSVCGSSNTLPRRTSTSRAEVTLSSSTLPRAVSFKGHTSSKDDSHYRYSARLESRV